MAKADIFQAAQSLLAEQYQDQYQAFAGCDITPYIGNVPIGTLQALTYSVARETGSLYSMGGPNVKAFVRGKRAISGTLVFTQFDRDVVIRIMDALNATSSNPGASSRQMSIGQLLNINPGENRWVDSNVAGWVAGNAIGPAGVSSKNTKAFGSRANKSLNATMQKVLKRPFKFGDQMPPFNITITLVNEQGGSAIQSFMGVILVNQGGGYTVDDLQSQVAYTFLARDMTPLIPAGAAQNGPYREEQPID